MPDSKRLTPESSSEIIGTIDRDVLTAQMLWREIAALKELTNTKIAAVETSIRVAHEDLVRVPTEVQKTVGHLQELTKEKLNSICTELHALETVVEGIRNLAAKHQEADQNTGLRVVEISASLTSFKDSVLSQKLEANHAVTSALAAAKELSFEQNKAKAEAINKSEAATSKQIQDLNTLLLATNNAIEGKVYEVKDRLTKIESKVEGVKEFKTDSRDNGKYLLAIAAFVFGLFGPIIGWIILRLRP